MSETRYRFVFGVGRSGTTLLARLLALSTTPLRFASELCPGIGDRIPDPAFMVEPGDAATVAGVRDAIVDLGRGKSPFSDDQQHRIERSDSGAEALLIKDIHSLFAYREILEGLGDWRAVVIRRDTSRILDSYFHGTPASVRRYLVGEYGWIARRAFAERGDPLLEHALAELPARIRRYFRRPRLLTSEIFRQAAVTHLMGSYLDAWVASEARLIRIAFTDLCRDPLAESLRAFDFLDLEYGDETLAQIQRMTSGSSRGYYATDKDSAWILRQPYKFLDGRTLARVRAFLAEPESRDA